MTLVPGRLDLRGTIVNEFSGSIRRRFRACGWVLSYGHTSIVLGPVGSVVVSGVLFTLPSHNFGSVTLWLASGSREVRDESGRVEANLFTRWTQLGNRREIAVWQGTVLRTFRRFHRGARRPNDNERSSRGVPGRVHLD